MEQLSDVQLAFMRALWGQPGSTVTQVREFLAASGRDLAPTTVSTQLGRLEKKGLVDHEVEGRQHLYRALVSEEDVQRSALVRLKEQIFQGDVAALVHQLLDPSAVDADELKQVRELIEQAAKHKDKSPTSNRASKKASKKSKGGKR